MSTPPTAPMHTDTGSMPPKCNRVTYMALAFVFGAIGIHNFVAGHLKKGYLQLALGLGGVVLSVISGLGSLFILGAWVWALIDMITVTQDGNGIPFDGSLPATKPADLTTGSPIPNLGSEPAKSKAA
ncbi:MAG: TM2 domain-containing protein [Phycisphaerales bacterium]